MTSFEKVGECLYRYLPTGNFYARFEINGRETRRSLRTTDRALAKRRLADLQRTATRVAPGVHRVTLADLCDRYLVTIRNQAPKTIYRKEAIAKRVKTDWPGGSDVPISRVLPSHIATWLASYCFGIASYNLHLLFVTALFDLATADRLIADSPAATMKTRTPPKPIRKTPTFGDFTAIISDVRAQIFSAEANDSGDFLEFLGLAGLGQAEAAALRWTDIDWERERITTFRQKTSQGFIIPLYPQLRPLLERIRSARGNACQQNEPVFRVRDAKKALTAACRRLQLPAYSQRALRRMFITRALERGIDVKTVALWQGHRDGGKLILDTYSHVHAVHSDRMAKLMA